MTLGPNYVFIAVPRTGSVSITSWLTQLHHGINVEPYHGTDIPRTHCGHPIVAVVRDPYTRLPSLHRLMVERFWTNPEWLKSEDHAAYLRRGMPTHMDLETHVRWMMTHPDNKWGTQARMLGRLKAQVTHLLRFEDLPKCLLTLPFISTLEGFDHLNATQPGPVLTERERAAIYEHSREDFERYGYTP